VPALALESLSCGVKARHSASWLGIFSSMTRPQRAQTYSPISGSSTRFVLPHSGHLTVTICFVTIFHPVYVDNYNMEEAIFKYDVCHISSLRLSNKQLTIGAFDKTYLARFLK
jgi:hypothetical protein